MNNKLTPAEKRAIKARAEEYIKEGVDKKLAMIIAKAEFDAYLIKPVVNGI